MLTQCQDAPGVLSTAPPSALLHAAFTPSLSKQPVLSIRDDVFKLRSAAFWRAFVYKCSPSGAATYWYQDPITDATAHRCYRMNMTHTHWTKCCSKLACGHLAQSYLFSLLWRATRLHRTPEAGLQPSSGSSAVRVPWDQTPSSFAEDCFLFRCYILLQHTKRWDKPWTVYKQPPVA